MRFILTRLIWGILSLFAASIFVFLATNALPGDAVDYLLSPLAPEEQKVAIREKLELDRPIFERYTKWLDDFVSGDMGISFRSQKPVGPLLTRRLTNSLLLAIPSILIGSLLAITLGTLTAYYKGGFLDKLISFTTLLGLSLPEFIIGVVLILVFSLFFGITPATSISNGAFSFEKLVLPALTAITVMQAHVSRITKSSVLEELKSNYVLSLRARGFSELKIVTKALRNALLPTLGVIGLEAGWMLGGLVVIEKVFAYPGMGQLLLDSIVKRDVPIIQATFLTITLIYIMISLFIDLGQLFIDPKMRS